jgi:hypothetical protein
VAQQLWPWPEPRSHALLKVGLAHLERGVHGLAEEFFRLAWALLEEDTWLRWRWHIRRCAPAGITRLKGVRRGMDLCHPVPELATQTDSRKTWRAPSGSKETFWQRAGDLRRRCRRWRPCAVGRAAPDALQWLGRRPWQGPAAWQGPGGGTQLTQATQTIEAIAANQ